MPDYLCQFNMMWNIPDGDVAQNTLYMHHRDCTVLTPGDVTFSDTEAAQQAANLATAWKAHLAAIQAENVTCNEITWCWNESVDNGPLHVGSVTGGDLPVTGTNTEDALPSGVSLSLLMQTGLAGRSRHGRIFLVGAVRDTTSGSDENTLAPATVAAWQGLMADFLAAWPNNDCVAGVGDQYDWVVVSYVQNKALRATAIDTKVVAFNLADPFYDYQRRRAPGHGRHG